MTLSWRRGSPTAPKKIASNGRSWSSASAGIIRPCVEVMPIPTGTAPTRSGSRRCRRRVERRAWPRESPRCPIPSPGITATRYVFIAFTTGRGVFHQRKPIGSQIARCSSEITKPMRHHARLRDVAGAEDDRRRAGAVVRHRGVEAREDAETRARRRAAARRGRSPRRKTRGTSRSRAPRGWRTRSAHRDRRRAARRAPTTTASRSTAPPPRRRTPCGKPALLELRGQHHQAAEPDERVPGALFLERCPAIRARASASSSADAEERDRRRRARRASRRPATAPARAQKTISMIRSRARQRAHGREAFGGERLRGVRVVQRRRAEPVDRPTARPPGRPRPAPTPPIAHVVHDTVDARSLPREARRRADSAPSR